MSEEQNDSPAFRLRPRRAAPKSYYTVRVEYSANPAAFISERPRSSTKRKVFTQKTGSNSTRTGSNQGTNTPDRRPFLVTKEELEREQRRLMLCRDISESITTDAQISAFMERLSLNELEPNSVYNHNYITLQIKGIDQSEDGKLLTCFCQSTSLDNSELPLKGGVNVLLYDEYASTSLVKPEKIINIAKFKTGPKSDNADSSQDSSGIDLLPFNVIVKFGTNDSTDVGSLQDADSTANTTDDVASSSCLKSGAVASNLIPFVSITDMIEEPLEPFVEMSPPSQVKIDTSYDHENQEAKKVKFTANL